MARPGEDALIARHFAPISGPGADALRDDAASLTLTPGHDLVVTADAIVAGVHFFPDDRPASLARKALGVNLSDLAAKGARPRGFLLTLALPRDWTDDWLAAFAAGLGAASAATGCPLLGGDTVRSNGGLMIAVTAFGEVPTDGMVRRPGASVGDVLCVTGTIGDAALGLAARSSPDAAWARGLAPEHREMLLDRYLHPRPRLALAPVLRGRARAAMDVSDGLAGDLAKMLRLERLTARVRIADVPLSAAARAALADDPALVRTVLTGGDDYEILCAVPPDAVPDFLAEARAAEVPTAAIGVVEAGEAPPVFVAREGRELRFEAGSFSHF